ncbi:BAG domain [Dillenia turbinata]|uniref:BAG domain n=1 Tax=Dillenia turbinata TaxID=194707 RepID=A0AAN8YYX8_9MAGN
MYPLYSYTHHPHRRNQMPFVQYHHPSFEAVLPQMKVDPTRFSSAQEFCLCGGSYGYLAPMAGHFCCGHSHSPGYYSCQPPYSYPPPPVYHCYGFPEANAVHYVTPPHYSMEQPRYEYDKIVPMTNHCCGCPYHQSNFKGDKSVKIEEHEPEVLKEDSNMNSEERKPGRRRCEGDTKKAQRQEREENKNQFPLPIIWMPPYWKPEDQEKEQHQPEEIEQKHQQGDSGSKRVRAQPWNFKVIPMKLLGHDDDTKRPVEKKEANANEAPSEIAAGRAVDKSIPAKQDERPAERSIHMTQEEQPAEKKTTEVAKRKTRDIRVKHIGDDQEMKPSKTGAESKSTSPRTTKLPPVCLRLDPLPRKKSSLMSPSPPGIKEKCSTSSEKTGEMLRETEVGKPGTLTNMATHICGVGSTKPVAESAETGFAEMRTEAHKGAQVAEFDEGEKTVTEDNESADESKIGGDGGAEEMNDMSFEELKGKNLSDAEAATLIQSLYRGFLVRKWEPLKKLKQIAEVRAKMFEVRNRIQELESSPDLWRDNKTGLIISETIMTLLLKLDTIQSLHPSVREIRKSVAKELVSLQEKLDLLLVQKVQGQMEAASNAESVEDVTAGRTDTKLYIQAQRGEIGGEHGQDLSQVDVDGGSDTAEQQQCPEQPKMIEDSVSALRGEHGQDISQVDVGGSSDTAEQQQCRERPKMTEDSISAPEGEPSEDPLVVEKEVSEENEEEVTDPFQACDLKSEMTELMPTVEANALESCESSSSQDFQEGLDQSVSSLAVTNELMNFDMEVGGLFSEEPTDSASNLKIDTSPVGDLSSVDENRDFTDEASVTGEEHAPLSFERNIDVDTAECEVVHCRKPDHDKVIDNMEPKIECGVADFEVMVSNEIPDASSPSGEDTAMDKVLHQPSAEVEENCLEKSQEAEKIKLQRGNGLDAVELLLPDKQENEAVDEVDSSQSCADVVLASEDKQVLHLGTEEDTSYVAGVAQVEEKDLSEEKRTWKLENESEFPGDITLVEDDDAVKDDTVVETKIAGGVTGAASSQPCLDVEIIPEHKEVLAAETEEHTEDDAVAAEEKEIVLLDGVEQISNFKAEPAVHAVKDEIVVETKTAPADGEEMLDNIVGSPIAGHAKDTGNDSERSLVEENEKLREMLEKLMEAGKEQLRVISELTGRVKDLEKKLNRKKRLKSKCSRTPVRSPPVRSPRKRLVESSKA